MRPPPPPRQGWTSSESVHLIGRTVNAEKLGLGLKGLEKKHTQYSRAPVICTGFPLGLDGTDQATNDIRIDGCMASRYFVCAHFPNAFRTCLQRPLKKADFFETSWTSQQLTEYFEQILFWKRHPTDPLLSSTGPQALTLPTSLHIVASEDCCTSQC